MERRQENLLDLCDSGRWRHYYTEAEFIEEMRKMLRLRDQWAVIAGLPAEGDVPLLDGRGLLPGALGGLPPSAAAD